MAFTIELINGVTKAEINNAFVYSFPIATIIALTGENQMVITYNNQNSDYQNPTVIDYADITDVLGSVDIEGYVDALATDGYFV